jgi:hypothetical protein
VAAAAAAGAPRPEVCWDLFDWGQVGRAFDRTAWERDGFVVLEGVMRPGARAEWRAALERVQAANDHFVLSDWDALPLAPGLVGYSYGSELVTEPVVTAMPCSQPTMEERRAWLGGCKQVCVIAATCAPAGAELGFGTRRRGFWRHACCAARTPK